MKRPVFLAVFVLMISCFTYAQRHGMFPEITPAGKGFVNTRVDNIAYWNDMIRFGFVKSGQVYSVNKAKFNSSYIRIPGLLPQNSPDVPVSESDSITQSENSVFIDPEEEEMILSSNNSTNWFENSCQEMYGADGLISADIGQSWTGTLTGVERTNGGDPSAAIGLNGWLYVGKISNDGGQSLAYSPDRGKTWKDVIIVPGSTTVYGILDKNHLCIDNDPGSSYMGFLYAAWTNFLPGSPDTNQVQVSRSADQGLHWTSPLGISREVSAGKFNHGVNLQTGPKGEVYAVWSIYDSWPSDETAIGFSKSIDGGGIFTPAKRILDNIKGIRLSLTGKNMRVNSFPSMAVDHSEGPNQGMIYIVWANIGLPGINTGSDIDIYLIRSADQGETWSSPTRVNQDPGGLGKQHYFPWITCDPVTGGLCVIYYDDRNLSSTDCETFVSFSYDGGLSWTDLCVSDVSFTPAPIPGLTFGYFGDYIGIQSQNMKVYPVWTDNRSGRAMSYVSPFDLGPNPDQPWVVFYQYTLSQIPSEKTQNMNYGDSLYLSLSLKNTGDQPALNVHAKITSASPYILITDSTADYGDIDPDSVKTILQGFSFRVSDTIPDNLMVRIDIVAEANDTTWFSHFSIESHAPGLKINHLSVIDSLGIKPQGRIDPGETALIKISTINTGDFPCDSVSGYLSSDSPLIDILNNNDYLGTISPGESAQASFQIVADPDLPVGTTVNFNYQTKSGKYQKTKIFPQVIGLIAEDWESNSFQKFPWQLSGNANWSITNHTPWEGLYCSQSGNIRNDETSTLSVSYTSAVEDSLSFYLKTSTELDYDLVDFYIDDVFLGSWSGVIPWKRVSFPVGPGTHRYTWTYSKDIALSSGEDKVWLDFINFPAPLLPVVNAGEDDTICPGQAYRMHAFASSYDSIFWEGDGDGQFDTTSIVNPVYTPGAQDILKGEVTLKLNVFSNYSRVAKSMHLHIGCEGINETDRFPNVKIYPNPGDGRFTLDILSPHPGPLTLCIFGVNNELIYMKKENICFGHWKKKFNFVSLPAGSYLMTIETDENTEVRRLIFVK